MVRIDLQQAALADDLERATDCFAAYSLPAARLALRVRSYEYVQRFGHEIVLRAGTRSGAPSEAEKALTNRGSAQCYVRPSPTPR